jgi:hypothetical protein
MQEQLPRRRRISDQLDIKNAAWNNPGENQVQSVFHGGLLRESALQR